MRKLILLLTALLSASVARAEDVTCTIKSVARCACPASMSVACPHASGYIANEQKVKSATFLFVSASGKERTLVIANPREGIRNYYAAQYNDEVRAEIARLGLRLGDGDRVSLQSFVSDSKPRLYRDPHRKASAE